MTCRSVAGSFTLGLHVVPPLCPPPGTGSAASPAGATAAAGGGSRLAARPPSLLHPSPASLRTINRPHTQLRSLSPRSEPQMYFMGERRPRVVKHPRGCRRCARCWAPACGARAWGAREPAGACGAGGLCRREGGRRAAPQHPPAPQQPWSSPGAVAQVQLTSFDQGGQASCVTAKGLIKYLAAN